MDDQPPIELVTELLLPVALRAELCITGITVSTGHDLLRFRIDPGNAFERRGYVRSDGAACFVVGVAERYLPESDRAHVCGCDGVPASDVPDQLRAASGWAYTRDSDRDHWLDARSAAKPGWSEVRKMPEAGMVIPVAQQLAARKRAAVFVFTQPGAVLYGNNPPGPGKHFCSVTMRGDWSLHQDRVTYPLDAPPDATLVRSLAASVAPPRRAGPVQLAQTEHPWASAAVVVPFKPRNGPVPATGRPTRRKRQP